jgi:hypothetical protein
MFKVVGAALVLSAAFGATASIAQGQTAPQDRGKSAEQAVSADQNEIICERQEVTGSRLAKRRVCMTRAQWAESRLQDRQATEKVQTNGRVQGE